MTGVELRVMKFIKVALTALMMVMTGNGQATTTTATLAINVTFTQPSCDIKVPSSYDLGSLNPGSKEHGDLKITWICEGNRPVKTALTAGIVMGTADGDNKVRLMTGGGQATGAALSLKEKKSGTLIKLTGHDVKDYFCSDRSATIGMHTCTLTPITEVDHQGPFGLASATLNFAVAYP
ncbi:TPA: F18 fimbrial protein FedE [Escherichia coli]|nr:F18 fimbrial protein FedE [Escherichia coli]HCP1639653.1 F18 fimbrial protein FedE [Escherichia coli]